MSITLKRNAKIIIPASFLALAAIKANAADTGGNVENIDHNNRVLEKVMVIGNKENTHNIPGSAHFIDNEELDKYQYSDANRVLRSVPGVNIQEEEGYGNRPNIGLRGGRSERSADINLMEDGILIAPAPYAAPSAYYFPRVSKMEGVEVRTGSSTVKFGPRSTSGTINFITPQIPNDGKGKLFLGYGSNNTERAEIQYGDSHGRYGYVINVNHEATDGFKEIDVVGGDTGYSIQDFMAKFRISSDPTATIFQSVEFKIGATSEDSDETYLGITDSDFATDPFRRYAGSQVDNMDANHEQFHIRHYADFNSFDITTTAYRNNFSRNWYKLQSVEIAGSSKSLSDALDDATYLDALKGTSNLDGGDDNNLKVRANDRDYYSTGIQSDLSTKFKLGQTAHKLDVGLRYHADQEDRFQQEDSYSITDGVMNLTSAGAPGSNANREGDGQSYAAYLLDEINVNNWTISPGARYEHIILQRTDYNSNTQTENTIDVIVPGIGATYHVSEKLNVFSGVHKGFAPPEPGSTSQSEEKSVNYEAGVKYNSHELKFAFTAFFNDYSNLLGTCTLSSGDDCDEGEQFNAGAVTAKGIEIGFSYDLAPKLDFAGISLPILANYTYTRAEFKEDFSSDFDEWGDVSKGDELPYIPRHQYFISAGIENKKSSLTISGKFTDEMRTVAGKGEIAPEEKTDANFVTDIVAEHEVAQGARIFLGAFNIFDETYIAARRPAGVRPGAPQTFLAGLKYKF